MRKDVNAVCVTIGGLVACALLRKKRTGAWGPMEANEKRLHPRKDVFSAAMLVLGDDGYLSEVWDISQGGARLGKPKKWPTSPPDLIRVFFMLDQDTVISLAA